VKLPVPEASVVFELDVVGPEEVFQHTPRAVTAAPPSLVIFPPQDADEEEIEEAVVVDMVGKTADAVKVI